MEPTHDIEHPDDLDISGVMPHLIDRSKEHLTIDLGDGARRFKVVRVEDERPWPEWPEIEETS